MALATEVRFRFVRGTVQQPSLATEGISYAEPDLFGTPCASHFGG
jgi:hypothetical protein